MSMLISAVTQSIMFKKLTSTSVASHIAIQSIEQKRVLEQACCVFHLSVCLSVGWSVGLPACWMNCGKTADWIWMPLEVTEMCSSYA